MPSFGKWLDVAIPVALVGTFFTGLTIFEYQRKEEEVKDEKERDDEEKNETNHIKTVSPRRQFMLETLEPNPLQFTLVKDNEFVITYLFRTFMINNDKDNDASQLLPKEICQLLSQFIGPNDCRVEFWNNYKDKYSILSNNPSMSFNDGTYLAFDFFKPYSWIQELRLFMDGTYSYIYQIEIPVGFNMSRCQIECDIMGVWEYDNQQQLIQLYVSYKNQIKQDKTKNYRIKIKSCIDSDRIYFHDSP